MKRLTLVRHAKSSWRDSDLGDFDRPLNARGERDAPEMGERLARDPTFDPDLLVSSPALRARTTAGIIAEGLGRDPDAIVLIDEIYEASVGELLEVVRGLQETAVHVVLFGHNPGLTDLFNALGPARIDNLPTCAVARFRLDVDSWREASEDVGTLLELDYPKKPRKDER